MKKGDRPIFFFNPSSHSFWGTEEIQLNESVWTPRNFFRVLAASFTNAASCLVWSDFEKTRELVLYYDSSVE